MKIFVFDSSLWLARSIKQVFHFFSDAKNLELLTPPWVHFQVLTPAPIEMAVGMRIQYKLRLRGIPIRWESEITAWEPPRRSVDDQTHGPYRMWRHEHRFAPRGGGTECSDHMEYATIGGAIWNYFFVAPDVKRIFEYRRTKMEELFGGGETARASSA